MKKYNFFSKILLHPETKMTLCKGHARIHLDIKPQPRNQRREVENGSSGERLAWKNERARSYIFFGFPHW
jgi:hypothetical protein